MPLYLDPPAVAPTDGERNPLVRSQTKLAKFMLPQANQPASRRATCLCLSVGLFPLWGYERSSAHLYLYAPDLPDLYSKQSRTAGPPIFHVFNILYFIDFHAHHGSCLRKKSLFWCTCPYYQSIQKSAHHLTFLSLLVLYIFIFRISLPSAPRTGLLCVS